MLFDEAAAETIVEMKIEIFSAIDCNTDADMKEGSLLFLIAL